MIYAHPTLFTIGNHSYTHRDFRNLSSAEIGDELRRTEEAIAPYCDQNLRPFFQAADGSPLSSLLYASALMFVAFTGYEQANLAPQTTRVRD